MCAKIPSWLEPNHKISRQPNRAIIKAVGLDLPKGLFKDKELQNALYRSYILLKNNSNHLTTQAAADMMSIGQRTLCSYAKEFEKQANWDWDKFGLLCLTVRKKEMGPKRIWTEAEQTVWLSMMGVDHMAGSCISHMDMAVGMTEALNNHNKKLKSFRLPHNEKWDEGVVSRLQAAQWMMEAQFADI
mmetsp:Transcript_35120/g.88744  ORF Transcript_35120/g.88744 Transcript_35120/m.88744 type:complete len:187 (-) Transcript_35120:748-1308(-)